MYELYHTSRQLSSETLANFGISESFEFKGLALDDVSDTSGIHLNANRILKTLVNRTAANLTIVRKTHLTTDCPKTHVQLFLNVHLNFLWLVVVSLMSLLYIDRRFVSTLISLFCKDCENKRN